MGYFWRSVGAAVVVANDDAFLVNTRWGPGSSHPSFSAGAQESAICDGDCNTPKRFSKWTPLYRYFLLLMKATLR
jgi:hypothetical protein